VLANPREDPYTQARRAIWRKQKKAQKIQKHEVAPG
jgi:hypothetical protein